jgi:hypothetical protein
MAWAGVLATLLTLWAVACFVAGYFVLSSADSAVHEIEGLIGLLIGTVAFGSARIRRNAARPRQSAAA